MTGTRGAISADLAAYCDQLTYRPGETVTVHAHGDEDVRIDVIRLAPPYSTARDDEPVAGVAAVACRLTRQTSHPGSFAIVEHPAIGEALPGLTLSAWIWPTRLGVAAPQGIVAIASQAGPRFALALAGGCVVLLFGGTEIARIATPVMERQWTHVVATIDIASHRCTLAQTTKLPFPNGLGNDTASGKLAPATPGLRIDQVLIGACTPHAETFNGKIEAVRIESADGTAVIGAWDFSQDIATDRIRDISSNSRDGRLVNAPTRAVTGQGWTGDEVDFRHVPAEYAAIHFHDDDLEDAGWDAVARLALPADLASGAYAIGSTPFSLAVWISVIAKAQCFAPPSDPANNAFFLVRVFGRIARSTTLVSISTRPSSRNTTRPGQCRSA